MRNKQTREGDVYSAGCGTIHVVFILADWHIYAEILKNIIYGIVVSALTEAEVLLSFLMIFYYYYLK